MADFSAEFVVEDDGMDCTVAVQPSVQPGKAASAPRRYTPAKRANAQAPAQQCIPDSTDTAEVLDAHRLAQRQKQIDFGTNTIGYQRYLEKVPRNRRTKKDPMTPEIHQNISKRAFDGQVKAWRRQLHFYDTDAQPQNGALEKKSPAQRPKLSSPPQEKRVPGKQTQDQENREPETHEDQAAHVKVSGRDVGDAKRPREVEPCVLGGEDGYSLDAHEFEEQGPQPKRSTASRSMDTSHNQNSTAATTCAPAPATNPTSFAGLGLASRAAGITTAPLPRNTPAAVPAAEAPAQQRIPREDNVIALILGNDNSCMSTEGGYSNIGL